MYSVTKDQYYKILLIAREQLLKEGFPCPKIEPKDIRLVDEKYQFALDLNMLEEKRYRMSLIRLDEIICEMLKIPNKPMEKGFWLHFDDNFSREIPECWKTKSKKENAEKIFDIDGKEIDKYQTYNNLQDKVDPPKEEEKPKEKKEPKSTQKTDGTYSNVEFPDTYS